jgi:hypothetical protein
MSGALYWRALVDRRSGQLRQALGTTYEGVVVVKKATILNDQQIALDGQTYGMKSAGLGLQPGTSLNVTNKGRDAAASFVPADAFGGTVTLGGGGGGGSTSAGITAVVAGIDIAVSTAGGVARVSVGSGAASNGDVLTADGAGSETWETPAATHDPITVSNFGGSVYLTLGGVGGQVLSAAVLLLGINAGNISSGAATAGQVLKADGAGGCYWA